MRDPPGFLYDLYFFLLVARTAIGLTKFDFEVVCFICSLTH